jgi:hypothetical protein
VAQAAETNDVATPMSVSGTYRTRNDLHLTLAGAKGTRTVDAAFVAGSESPPAIATVASSYTGFSGHTGGKLSASVSIDAAGAITGRNSACNFTGTVAPLASVNAYRWTVQRVTGNCIFGLSTPTGVLWYDDATKQLRGFAPFNDRFDQFFFIGTRSF